VSQFINYLVDTVFFLLFTPYAARLSREWTISFQLFQREEKERQRLTNKWKG
jgi:hypothetical protein